MAFIRQLRITGLTCWHRSLFTISGNRANKCGNVQSSQLFSNPEVFMNSLISRHITTSTYLGINNKSVTTKLKDLSSLVDKMAYEIMSEIKSKNRVYRTDFMRFVDKINELRYATPQHVSLLINCCTNLIPEVSQEDRIQLLDTIWKKIGSFYIFNINNYNDVLLCYKENKHKFKVSTFLDYMQPITPNERTYYNLLAAVCENGDVNQAQEILANMNVAKVPVIEECFNNLIEGYGHARDMNSAKNILGKMEVMRINPSLETQLSLIKAAVCSESLTDLDKYIADMQNKSIACHIMKIMDIVKCMANMNLKKYVSKILKLLPEETWQSSDIPPAINASCVQLIYDGHPETAYDIYSKFSPPVYGINDNQNLYFRKLLRESVKASTPVDVIKYICSDLIDKERNMFSYQVACEAALQTYNINLATSLIIEMKEKGHSIRPHYFWPMFVHSAKVSGETSIFEVISLMNSVQVTPDFDTFVDYIFPHINVASPQMTVKKLQTIGLSVSTTLTPILFYILKENRLQEASELCEIHPSKLDCDYLINPLVQAFFAVGHYDSLFVFLDAFIERPANDKKDWLGLFLVSFLSTRKFATDFENFESILKYITKHKVFISKMAGDMCVSLVISSKLNIESKERIKEILTTLVDKKEFYETELFEQFIQHPKEMNLKQLEYHLIELESKKMNTRGVLRKLLQEYCRFGMTNEAKTVIKKCEDLKFSFSAGMLASIIDVHVKCRDLEKAEKYFHDLQKAAPNFHLDEHKVLDYVTLLVSNGKRSNALSLLENHGKKVRVYGGAKLESNCWKLLDTIAKSKNPKETEKFFSTLCRLGFCQPSNIILGPLMRCHLYNSDIFGAVEEFLHISNMYKKTPLKHELLCRLLVLSSGAPSSNEEDKSKQEMSKKYVSQILDCDKKVHGNTAAQLSLVVALADSGLKKQLRKYVLDPSVSINEVLLIRQCERLGEENKINALEIIAECVNGLRNTNTDKIYEIIMNVHSLNSDCDSALSLWTKMQENNIKPTQKFTKIFSGLLRSHKYDLPPDLIGYLGDTSRTQAMER